MLGQVPFLLPPDCIVYVLSHRLLIRGHLRAQCFSHHGSAHRHKMHQSLNEALTHKAKSA